MTKIKEMRLDNLKREWNETVTLYYKMKITKHQYKTAKYQNKLMHKELTK